MTLYNQVILISLFIQSTDPEVQQLKDKIKYLEIKAKKDEETIV